MAQRWLDEGSAGRAFWFQLANLREPVEQVSFKSLVTRNLGPRHGTKHAAIDAALLAHPEFPNHRIAKMFDVHRELVRKRRKLLGIPPRPQNGNRPSVDGELSAHPERSNQSIADEFGRNPTYVRQRRRELGLPDPPKKPRFGKLVKSAR